MRIKDSFGQRKTETTSAFTLVEVLVAMALFTLLSLGILSSILYTRRVAENISYDNIVLTLLQGYIEQMRALEYDVLYQSAIDPSEPITLLSYTELDADGVTTPSLQRDAFYNGVTRDFELVIDTENGTRGAHGKKITVELTPQISEIRNSNSGSILVTFDCNYEIYQMSGSAERNQRVSMVVAPWD